ncbi:MAG: PDZ domain-containing protein [Saprospiraceae bacterium]|nr:PDZ domain-containing protein [Saprospiraceae bacterium]
MKLNFILINTLFLFFLINVLSAQGTQLLREPTIHNNEVVFVYANDLWKGNIESQITSRLTTNKGYETNPHFSNDGKWIAFSAEYNGNFDVFIIPSEGGEPTQLTWHPGGDFVQGWTPEGEILFRSGRESKPTQTSKFYTISTNGGYPKTFDIPRAAYGEISTDGNHVAYVPITSWDPEWRNYRGGQAMPIWIVNMNSKELIRTPQTDKERHLSPIWHNDVVFYLSERDYASNIWSYNPKTGVEKQHTFHQKYDVKSMDGDGTLIIYEQGGYLHILNPEDDISTALSIEVKGDMNYARERWENIGNRNVSNPYISPNGKRVLFESRGEIFSVPKDKGTWRNLSNNPLSAERSPAWSPKGDKISWFSDESGEYELIISDQSGKKIKIISIADPSFYFQPQWSPDGKFLAFSDTHYNIKVVNVNTGLLTNVDTDGYAHPNRTMNPVWSPDSKWIAYPKQLNSHFKAIFAFNILTKENVQMTDGMADAISPVWDEGGEYLYFLASTDYGLNSGWLDMSSFDPDVTRSLYAVILSNHGKAPNLPESDEEKKEEKEVKDKDQDDAEAQVVISPQGIEDRIVALKFDEGACIGLVKGPKNNVFVIKSSDDGSTLIKYDVKKEESENYISGISQALSNHNGDKILVRKGSQWVLSSTGGKPDLEKDGLKINIKLKVDPKKEYHQIFKEGWRYMRDFLYVDNVHGAPWNKVYEWYAPWIDHVRNRADLNYVVDIMSGEVAIGHSYVRGGDNENVESVRIGLLGCDFEISESKYRITKIYTGESWNPSMRSPLHLQGIGISEGDYVLSIENQPLTSNDNIYRLLEQTADREISIEVAKNANGDESKNILIKPIFNERRLRNTAWVESNRRKVDELSGGKLAYVYVPNTGGGGFTNFNRYYFAQQDKKGVIIDERNNGGGSAADYMIDIMSRELFGYFNSKAGDNRPWTTPISGIWGPKVMLINERAGSGGDLLPYMFHAKELGPMIGTRTWGGLVGTWDTPAFIDGGRMVAPRGGFFDVEGEWAVEGEGISPDIEVIQHPKMVLDGHDPQLEKGIEEAMRLLNENEFQMKKEPAAPIRWKRPEGFKE